MHPVKWIASLEGDHTLSAVGRQSGPRLRRTQTQLLEISMMWQLQDLQGAGDAEFAPTVHFRQWMALVKRAEYGPGYLRHIPFVNLLECHDGQQVVLCITQGHILIQVDGWPRVDREGHGDGKEMSAGQ